MYCFFKDLNSPLLFGRLNGLSSDSTIDILYQLGTTQDAGTKDRYSSVFATTQHSPFRFSQGDIPDRLIS